MGVILAGKCHDRKCKGDHSVWLTPAERPWDPSTTTIFSPVFVLPQWFLGHGAEDGWWLDSQGMVQK